MSTKDSTPIFNKPNKQLEEQLAPAISDRQFIVEKIYGITLTRKELAEISKRQLVVKAVYVTGEKGYPKEDTFSQAETVNELLSHPTCTTNDTEGYPVWFECCVVYVL